MRSFASLRVAQDDNAFWKWVRLVVNAHRRASHGLEVVRLCDERSSLMRHKNAGRMAFNSLRVSQGKPALPVRAVSTISVGGGLGRWQGRKRRGLCFGEVEFLLFVLQLVEAVIDAALG